MYVISFLSSLSDLNMCCRILFTVLIICLDVFVSYKLWDDPPLMEYYFGRMITTIGLQFLSFTLLIIIWLIEGKYCGKVGNSCMNSETGMCLTLILGMVTLIVEFSKRRFKNHYLFSALGRDFN